MKDFCCEGNEHTINLPIFWYSCIVIFSIYKWAFVLHGCSLPFRLGAVGEDWSALRFRKLANIGKITGSEKMMLSGKLKP